MGRMRLLIPCMVVGILVASAVPLTAQSREERAVRALIDRLVQSNNSVDEKVAQQPLADLDPGAGPYFPPFTESVGAAGLEPMLTQVLLQLSSRSFAISGPLTIHVDKNLGWAAFQWHAEFNFKDGTHHALDGRTTAAFARHGKEWKVTHWHSSMPGSFPLTKSAMHAEAKQIIQIERDAWEAIKNKQLDKLADYYADDASVFTSDQAYRITGKDQVVSNLKSWLAASDVRAYQMLDPKVQIFGNTALLSYYFTYSGVSGGKDFSTSGRFTAVFVKRGGKWLSVHEHESTNR